MKNGLKKMMGNLKKNFATKRKLKNVNLVLIMKLFLLLIFISLKKLENIKLNIHLKIL